MKAKALEAPFVTLAVPSRWIFILFIYSRNVFFGGTVCHAGEPSWNIHRIVFILRIHIVLHIATFALRKKKKGTALGLFFYGAY